MSKDSGERPTTGKDGWTLVSAEERHAAHPETFPIPPREARTSLRPGDAAKLLFDIATKEGSRVIDRGVDRMWVIVKARVNGGYLGVLDNDPGVADGLLLRAGANVHFGPEHIAAIGHPPRQYILDKYGADFYTQGSEGPATA